MPTCRRSLICCNSRAFAEVTGVTGAEFAAVRALLEDPQTWAVAGRGTVADLADRITSGAPGAGPRRIHGPPPSLLRGGCWSSFSGTLFLEPARRCCWPVWRALRLARQLRWTRPCWRCTPIALPASMISSGSWTDCRLDQPSGVGWGWPGHAHASAGPVRRSGSAAGWGRPFCGEVVEEGCDVAAEQVGLLGGWEVAAAGHGRPPADVVQTFGPLAGRRAVVDELARKTATAVGTVTASARLSSAASHRLST